jgi:hypothetical protein
VGGGPEPMGGKGQQIVVDGGASFNPWR